MTLHFQKAFDLVSNLFLITALEKYGFKKGFYQKDANSNIKSRILRY